MSEARVTKDDLRELGICFKGARPWFTSRGVSWSEFIESGIEVNRLREIGDHISERVIRHRLAKNMSDDRKEVCDG